MSLVLSIYKCKYIYMPVSIYTLVGGLEHVLFFIIYGIILPIYFHIFQDGWNHQPDTWSYIMMFIPILSSSHIGITSGRFSMHVPVLGLGCRHQDAFLGWCKEGRVHFWSYKVVPQFLSVQLVPVNKHSYWKLPFIYSGFTH